jgi:uncharacterized protein with ATP-grasp and redox domains
LDCAIKQCRKIAALTGGDSAEADRVAAYVSVAARDLSLEEPPSTYTSHILLAAMGLLDEPDPFADLKADQNREAAEAAERLDGVLDDTPDPLKAALELAAAGNVLDSGPRRQFSLESALAELAFARDDCDELAAALGSARKVMCILDNAGEVMFDRLALKRLPRCELTIVARSSPILNDVTVDEARELGFEQYGRLIGTGSPYLGIDFGTVSNEFKTAYAAADVVIGKGHANYESLVDDGRDGWYVLKAKCDHVAGKLGVGLGQAACVYSEGRGTGARGQGSGLRKERVG